MFHCPVIEYKEERTKIKKISIKEKTAQRPGDFINSGSLCCLYLYWLSLSKLF